MDDSEHDYRYWFLVQQEAEKIADARMTGAAYKAGRLAIRSARVAFGLTLVIVGVLILFNTEGLGDVPFAQLTLGMLFGHAITVIFALGLVWFGFVAAFGASPSKSDVAKKFSAQAEMAVKAARDRARMNT